MPHFFASLLESITYPIKCDKFYFEFEAKSLANNHSIILAKGENEEILLLKQTKNNKILIKYNKHLKISSKEAIKQALSEYAKITNAKIISHNLTLKNKQEMANKYLLDINSIFAKITNSKNVMIEIGFGSGRHLLDLAKNNKDTTFVGIEIYRPAILQILRQIELLELKNLFIINADCRILFEILPSSSIDRIFMHFPVPWEKNEQKRVLSKSFLDNALRILKINCFFELRTDSLEYASFAKEIAQQNNIRIDSTKNAKESVISKYEARWLRQNKDIFTIHFYNDKLVESSLKNIEQENDLKEGKDLALKNLKIDINKLINLNKRKFCREEYFLHIKDIYEFKNGYILFIVFGSYYAPNSIYLVFKDNAARFLGDFIPTNANISALNLIGVL